jgi:hypothetical protein
MRQGKPIFNEALAKTPRRRELRMNSKPVGSFQLYLGLKSIRKSNFEIIMIGLKTVLCAFARKK